MFLFTLNNDKNLLDAKREIFLQIAKFDIVIEAKGFLSVDRPFISAVSRIIFP